MLGVLIAPALSHYNHLSFYQQDLQKTGTLLLLIIHSMKISKFAWNVLSFYVQGKPLVYILCRAEELFEKNVCTFCGREDAPLNVSSKRGMFLFYIMFHRNQIWPHACFSPFQQNCIYTNCAVCLEICQNSCQEIFFMMLFNF